MLKRIIIAILMLSMFSVYSQDTKTSDSEDKYTTVNIMLSQIVQCREGLILKYFAKNEMKVAYIPNKMFKEKIAMKIDEFDTNISPQMNVILKNGKPFRVKLYLSPDVSNMTYRLLDVISDDIKENFKTNELKIDF